MTYTWGCPFPSTLSGFCPHAPPTKLAKVMNDRVSVHIFLTSVSDTTGSCLLPEHSKMPPLLDCRLHLGWGFFLFAASLFSKLPLNATAFLKAGSWAPFSSFFFLSIFSQESVWCAWLPSPPPQRWPPNSVSGLDLFSGPHKCISKFLFSISTCIF